MEEVYGAGSGCLYLLLVLLMVSLLLWYIISICFSTAFLAFLWTVAKFTALNICPYRIFWPPHSRAIHNAVEFHLSIAFLLLLLLWLILMLLLMQLILTPGDFFYFWPLMSDSIEGRNFTLKTFLLFLPLNYPFRLTRGKRKYNTKENTGIEVIWWNS